MWERERERERELRDVEISGCGVEEDVDGGVEHKLDLLLAKFEAGCELVRPRPLSSSSSS